MRAGDQPRIGFIGLGKMGSAIAERLVDAGRQLVIYDRSERALAPFVERGATVAQGPSGVADEAEIVFSCLPDTAVSLEVALGEQGVVNGKAVRVYVEMSTIGRPAMQKIGRELGDRRGIQVIDAPVSGGPKGARKGTLSIIAAAPAAALETVRPLFESIGRRTFVVGDQPGLAQTMKLVNNLLLASNMAAAFEALVLGAKAGIDADVMVDVLNNSTGRSGVMEDKVPLSVLPGTFDYGALLATMYKDVKLGLDEAADLGVPMMTLHSMAELWRLGTIRSAPDADFTSLIKMMEEWSGVEVRSSKALNDNESKG